MNDITRIIKLQLFLSRSGVCSRRKASDFIKNGCVKTNGVVIYEPSCRIKIFSDKVSLNGKEIRLKRYEYVLLNKPRGVTTTKKDRFAEKTVLDLLPSKLKHLNPVGRLDKDTTGLLFLTNDGPLAYRLTHPRFKVNKVYRLILNKILLDKDRRTLEKGVLLDHRISAPCKVKYIKNKKVEMTLYEGRKRQIKRMFSKLGYRVVSLERIKEGILSLGNLPLGEWRWLSQKDIKRLLGEVKTDEE